MDLWVKPLVPRPATARPQRPSREEAEAAVRTLLSFIGDDPDREGLKDTPRRVVRAYEELFSGYGMAPEPILARTFKEVGGYDDIVLVRDIPFQSFCEHHMLPFRGQAHIGYYPTDGVIGLSKLARLVDVFARRLQTQETLTQQIIDALDGAIAPKGVAVMLSAEHLCMSMRGVRKEGSCTTTTAFTGVFAKDAAERDKFFRLVHAPHAR